MPTSTSPTEPRSAAGRGSLRLRIALSRGRDRLDGGWWPRSRDLTTEVVDLVDDFPVEAGRVVGLTYSPREWEPAPSRVRVSGGHVALDPGQGEDTHLVLLAMADGTVLRILVVPVAFSQDQGEEALLASATPGNSEEAAALLDAVADQPDLDLADIWDDPGGSYWDPHPVAPSYRRES